MKCCRCAEILICEPIQWQKVVQTRTSRDRFSRKKRGCGFFCSFYYWKESTRWKLPFGGFSKRNCRVRVSRVRSGFTYYTVSQSCLSLKESGPFLVFSAKMKKNAKIRLATPSRRKMEKSYWFQASIFFLSSLLRNAKKAKILAKSFTT